MLFKHDPIPSSAERPAIDVEAPQNVETATFALG